MGVWIRQMLSAKHSCSQRSKKWWHRSFNFLLDICIVNARLQSESPHRTNLTQNEFRLEIAREYQATMLASIESGDKIRLKHLLPFYSDDHFPDMLEKSA